MGRTSLYTNELMDRHLAELTPRLGGMAPAITVVLDRYMELMRLGRASLRGQSNPLSESEFKCLLAMAMSTLFEPAGIVQGAVLADAEDAGQEELSAFGVERAALLAKLRGLSPLEQFALVDWLEAEKAKT